jgi:hypothetical protein
MTFDDDDSGYHITNGNPTNPNVPALERVHLGITNLDLTLLDLKFDSADCNAPYGLFKVKGGVELKMQNIGVGLTMTKIRSANVKPGLFMAVHGDFESFDAGFYNLSATFDLGLGLSIYGRVAGINFEIPIVPTIGDLLGTSSPMILMTDRQPNSLGQWIKIPTPVPCRVLSTRGGPQVFHFEIQKRPHHDAYEVNRMSFTGRDTALQGVKWRAIPWIAHPLAPVVTVFNAVMAVIDLITAINPGLPTHGQPMFAAGFTCP